jgi:hypothetical protein
MTAEDDRLRALQSPRAGQSIGSPAAIVISTAGILGSVGASLACNDWLFRQTVPPSAIAAGLLTIFLWLCWPIWSVDGRAASYATSGTIVAWLALFESARGPVSGIGWIGIGVTIGVIGRLSPGDLARRWTLTTVIGLCLAASVGMWERVIGG